MALVVDPNAAAFQEKPLRDFYPRIEEALLREGHEVQPFYPQPEETMDFLQHISEDEEMEGIIAAGDDGLLAMAASLLIAKKKPLGILPLGKKNLLASDLRIPKDLGAAVKIIAQGQSQLIDVGDANGRIFLSRMSFGMHVWVENEISQPSRQAPFWKKAKKAISAFEREHRVDLTVFQQNQLAHQRALFLIITNNPAENPFGCPMRRQNLDAGLLGVYWPHSSSLADKARLAFRFLFSKEGFTPQMENLVLETLTLESKEPAIDGALDGDEQLLPMPLVCRVRKQALRVFSPPPPEEENPKEQEE